MTTSNTHAIPPPALLKVAGDVAADWERFKSEYDNYEIPRSAQPYS